MIYRRFYAQGSTSEGVRVILEEIEAPYQLIQSTKDISKSRHPEQLKISPNGWISVLIFGDNGIYECAAIIMFLCDRHPEVNLAPKYNASKRGLYLLTLLYFFSFIQTAFQTNYYPDLFVDTVVVETSVIR